MTARLPRRADTRAAVLLLAFGLASAGPLAAQQPTAQQPPAAQSAAPQAAVPQPAPTSLTVTLAEAIRRAEQVQPQVVQAQSGLRSAQARTRTATVGAYLPTVSFATIGSNSHSGGGEATVNQAGTVIPGGSTVNSLNTTLSANLDLFTGFRRGADARAARANETAADASLVNARFQQAFTTTNTFFDALAAQQLLAVRAASVRRAEEQLKVSVNKLHVGTATRSDSLRSTVTLGNAQLQLVQAQVQLATAEANLGRLVGAPGRVRATDDSSFYQSPPIDTASLRADALRGSPQVQSAEADAASARAQERSARTAYFPSLSLGANLGWTGNDRFQPDPITGDPTRNSITDLSSNRQVALQFRWSLFNGFQREQQVVQAAATADAAVAEASDARRQVDAGLTAALAQLDAARVQIGITQTSVAAAREDLRVVQDRYRLGASTIVDVLTSQEALNQAEVDVVTARFLYLRSKAQVEALLGHAL